jgi:hypothetical protein
MKLKPCLGVIVGITLVTIGAMTPTTSAIYLQRADGFIDREKKKGKKGKS